VYTSGTKYEGELQDGVPHGKGKVVFAKGGWYKGQFFEGFMQGKGKFSQKPAKFSSKLML
jgi:hypothetical protein